MWTDSEHAQRDPLQPAVCGLTQLDFLLLNAFYLHGPVSHGGVLFTVYPVGWSPEGLACLRLPVKAYKATPYLL